MDYKILFISQILFGALAAVVAQSRGRSPWIWFIVGMMFTWIGLLVLLILPSFSSKNKTVAESLVVLEGSKPKNEWENTSSWFYIDQSKVVLGPVTAKELKDLWKESKIASETWVWHEKIIEWKKLNQVVDITEWLNKI